MDLASWGIRTHHENMPNIVIIADPGKDLDDEFTFILAAALHKLGVINLLGVVANLYPANDRAKLTRGTFNCLGLPVLPVGVGLPVIAEEHRAKYGYETDVPYLDDTCIVDGQELLHELLISAKDGAITLVLQSGLTDAWELYKRDSIQFKQKVARVVIMGGVEITNDGCTPYLSRSKYLLPNNANNNSFDARSAAKLYEALQTAGIPMIITMRDAAYASQIPFSVYDDLVDTGNPVGVCLRNRQKPSLQQLWEAACSPPGAAIRGTLPADRDRDWFVKVFCQGNDPGIDGGADIWSYVGDFNLYDPVNLLAGIDGVRERFFKPTSIDGGGATHQIIGMSKKRTGVKDSQDIRKFLMEILTFALK